MLDMFNFGDIRPLGTVYTTDENGNTVVPGWALRGSLTRAEFLKAITGKTFSDADKGK
jgi:hypothetical protein